VEREQGSWAVGPTLDFMKPVFEEAKNVAKDVEGVLKPLTLLAMRSTTTRNTTKQVTNISHPEKNSTVAATNRANRTAGGDARKRLKLDVNQKVYIEGQLTIGNGEQGSFNKCNMFPSYMVDSPNKPTVKVCGTSIKMEVFLYGECNQGYTYPSTKSWTVGICDTSKPADHCETYSPKNDSTFGACQSWKASMC